MRKIIIYIVVLSVLLPIHNYVNQYITDWALTSSNEEKTKVSNSNGGDKNETSKKSFSELSNKEKTKIISNFSTKEKTDLMNSIADSMNKEMPKMIDSETRIDSVVGGSDMTLTYVITFVNLNLKSISKKEKNRILTFIQKGDQCPITINSTCTTPKTRDMLDSGFKYVWIYRDINGTYVGECSAAKINC